jgi:hypothetical protein
MVFAKNITPLGGWYTNCIKAMCLWTKGRTLSKPYQGDEEETVKYLRVNDKEDVLNGSPIKSRGVTIDSGTTNTYLPQGLKVVFDKVWKTALCSISARSKYHNNPVEMIPEEVKSLPTILLVLQGHSSSNANNKNAIGMTRSHKGNVPRKPK